MDIRDFFGKSKVGKTQQAKKITKPKKEPEIIDLDDLDDLDDSSLIELASAPKKINTRSAKCTTSPTKAETKKELFTKDEDEEDESVHKSQIKKRSLDSSPVKEKPKKMVKVTPAPKRESISSLKKEVTTATTGGKTATAQEILATIPSVDLHNVTVKENITFGGARGGDSSSEPQEPTDFPEGAPDCLLGLTIVFTGVLPNLDRTTSESIATRYGARVTKSISGKTSLVVLGDEAGPKKLDKIKQLKVKVIDEDGFRQLISAMPTDGGDGIAAEKARQKKEEQQALAEEQAQEMVKQEKLKESKIKAMRKAGETVSKDEQVREQDKLWTTKYAPTSLQQICGNKSAVTKLTNWLTNWETNKTLNFKKPGRDGSGVFRTAMLYGPPGIGKTTTAHLVAKELGYDILEQNASDVRSKSLLNAGVKNALDNMSIIGYFKTKDDSSDKNGKKFVIIMDEVDGMSGGDRGGVGQLAAFCRKTQTPMILICNERNLPKMRPFDRTCLDIQFRRPDANSIKARLMTIAIREGFKLDPTVIDKLVQATRGDVRQIINLLSTISKTTKNINHENITQISKAWEKNIALKPFDIAHKMLDGFIYTDAGSSTFTLNDKIALYFDDFDFAPLMIQENYINCKPSNLPPGKTPLQAVAEAAEIISLGDQVERKIRSSEQLWSLLPLHAVLSSVYPASKVAGHMSGRINFSSWLGQNSKTNKYYRLLQELQYHTRLSTSTDKIGLRLQYLPTLKNELLTPLLKEGSEGIPKVISTMDDYYLTKEDWDTIMDFMIGPDKTDLLLKKIPTAVKSAFTRKYNGTTHPVAIYKTGSTVAVGGSKSSSTPDFEDIVDADNAAAPADDSGAANEDNDLKKDKLIKQKARPTKRKAASSTTKNSATKKRKTKA
ncbi:similar to Saccharomyces cerevisiae YOR217W RFC1 Subunit of heteropentameric Replication factor C (RF-C) [Maudiozyma saulgeensis]|uniref:Replication factor C subunit 1 n=1 Tax=Maudiozyma saulgeensis TaxID=1789683 RepID=A0A1X7R3T3_9SACH|nr:similar to Saccharomyces cerevisiae YOR217W RFC1 Subunit of heteropentameric Replication factor C (RF-C) [Kazachstania saulgeensis]